MDRHGLYLALTAALEHTNGNLSAVGDQHLTYFF
jgi:hypothetical protein